MDSTESNSGINFDDVVGNNLYYKLGDDSIRIGAKGNLFVRVYRDDFPALFTDVSKDFLDFYTTAAGTKEEFWARRIGQSASEEVTGSGAIAAGNLGGNVESNIGNGTEVTAGKLIDTYGESLNILAENSGLTEQQAYDEAVRLQKEKEWNASYQEFINDMAKSSTLEELLRKIGNNAWVIKKYSDSRIPVYEHLDYLINNLAANEATTDVTYGAGGSYSRPDEYTLNEADDYGYEWKYDPDIGYYRTKAGELHYDDFIKLEKLKNILQNVIDNKYVQFTAGLGSSLLPTLGQHKEDYNEKSDAWKAGHDLISSLGQSNSTNTGFIPPSGQMPSLVPAVPGTGIAVPIVLPVAIPGVQNNQNTAWKRFSEDLNRLNASAEESNKPTKLGKAGNIAEKVEIVDRRGSPLGEIDKIDLKNGLFIEDKSAKGLNTINPRTGMPQQTTQEWADKQIFTKTQDRIKALENDVVATRATKDGTIDVPGFSEIRDFKKFEFRIDADTPELRQAVNNSIEQLRAKYPRYTFKAKFGGGQ